MQLGVCTTSGYTTFGARVTITAFKRSVLKSIPLPNVAVRDVHAIALNDVETWCCLNCVQMQYTNGIKLQFRLFVVYSRFD